jgi:HEAT repeat protein
MHAIVVGALLQLAAASTQGAATEGSVTSIGAAERDKLVAALTDQRVDYRRSAASALALRRDIGPAIPALYAALLDSDRAVRRSACEAIRRFRGAPEGMLRLPCLN